MGRAKIKPDRRRRNGALVGLRPLDQAQHDRVLTLAELATYLRVSEQDILWLIREQSLPGREIGNEWRFLRTAVDSWLGKREISDQTKFWQTHFGALRDDPYLAEIVREAYRKRGRRDDGNL